MEMDRVPPHSMQYSRNSVCTESWNQNHIDEKHDIDSLKAPKVHVNPNFRNGKSLVIHVNPRMHQNRKIHVNPKMMKDVVPVVEKSTKPVALDAINKVSCDNRLHSEEKSIKKSIHVNPKLMKKLSSIGRDNIKVSVINSKTLVADCEKAHSPVESKVNNNDVFDNKSSSKTSPPRLLALSRRKLVRISSSAKTTTAIHSPGSLKRLNRKSLTVAQVNTKKSASCQNLTKFNPIVNKYRTNAYKIDRTTVERRKQKKIRIPDARVRNVNKGLVAIGGVMYQSSRTQLVRSGTSTSVHKKKDCLANAKGDTFVMAKNGKKLLRLHTGKEGSKVVTRYMISRNSINHRSVVKKVPNSVVQSSHKNVISYKAKQRSLQILRDKLRKNYIPCLLYRRFGYCAKHANGTCPKLHDKKQVALCKNFLQGKCLLDNCPLSHDIGPEKMPTCKYFLEGCCIRDACPYLHVKVSPNTPLCAQFLRGYCADGNKCKQRHTYICPEYEKSGKCAKGKFCPYPHKLKSSESLVTKTRVVKNIRGSSSSKRLRNNIPSRVVESGESSRKRYYDKASPTDKQLVEMRENIIKHMKCMKASLGIRDSSDKTIVAYDEITIDDDVEETNCNYDERPKRAPIGPLPAYIPIN